MATLARLGGVSSATNKFVANVIVGNRNHHTAAIAKKCFRDITWPFCLAYRTKYFAGKDMAPCELTGRMTRQSTCEVDHMHPDTFEKLLADFLTMKQISIANVAIVKAEPKWILKDSSLAEAWQRHHDTHAVLRVLDTAAHVEHTKSLQLAALAA